MIKLLLNTAFLMTLVFISRFIDGIFPSLTMISRVVMTVLFFLFPKTIYNAFADVLTMVSIFRNRLYRLPLLKKVCCFGISLLVILITSIDFVCGYYMAFCSFPLFVLLVTKTYSEKLKCFAFARVVMRPGRIIEQDGFFGRSDQVVPSPARVSLRHLLTVFRETQNADFYEEGGGLPVFRDRGYDSDDMSDDAFSVEPMIMDFERSGVVVFELYGNHAFRYEFSKEDLDLLDLLDEYVKHSHSSRYSLMNERPEFNLHKWCSKNMLKFELPPMIINPGPMYAMTAHDDSLIRFLETVMCVENYNRIWLYDYIASVPTHTYDRIFNLVYEEDCNYSHYARTLRALLADEIETVGLPRIGHGRMYCSTQPYGITSSVERGISLFVLVKNEDGDIVSHPYVLVEYNYSSHTVTDHGYCTDDNLLESIFNLSDVNYIEELLGSWQVVDEQNGEELGLKDVLIGCVPGLSAFVTKHPALSVILGGTWLTRSFYACQHIPGLIATIVELCSFAELSVENSLVSQVATKLHSYFSSPVAVSPNFSDILPEPDDSRHRSTPLVEEQDDAAPIGPFGLLAAFAKAISGSGSLSKTEVLRVNAHRTAIAETKDFFAWIGASTKIFSMIRDWVRSWIFGPSDADRVGDLLLRWAEAAPRFALVDSHELNSRIAHELMELYEVGLSIQRHYMLIPEDIKATHGPSFLQTLSRAAVVYETCKSYKRNHGPRQEPVHIVLQGSAGTLKSMITGTLSLNTVFNEVGEIDRHLVYPCNFNMQHFDGYTPSSVAVIVDDYLQMVDDESRKAVAEFIFNSVNHTKYTLPMAGLPDKGMEFRSKLICSSTNVNLKEWAAKTSAAQTSPERPRKGVNPGSTPPFASMDGFLRRHHVVLDVSVKDKAVLQRLKSGDIKSYLATEIDEALHIAIVGRDGVFYDTPRPIAFDQLSALTENLILEKGKIRANFDAAIEDYILKRAALKKTNETEVKVIPENILDRMEARFDMVVDSFKTSLTPIFSRVSAFADHTIKKFEDSTPAPVDLTGTPSLPVYEQSKTSKYAPENAHLSKRQFRRARKLEQHRRRYKDYRSASKKRPTFYRPPPVPIGEVDEQMFDLPGLTVQSILFFLLSTLFTIILNKLTTYPVRFYYWITRRANVISWFTNLFVMSTWYGFKAFCYAFVHDVKLRWKRVTPNQKRFFAVLAVILVLLVVIGIVWYSRAKPVADEQYDAKERRAIKKARKKFVRIHPVKIREQSSSDPNCTDMINAIIKTSFGRINTLNTKTLDTSGTNMFCIGQGLAIVPRHLILKAEREKLILNIQLPKTTAGDHFHLDELTQYGDIEHTDVLVLEHPYFQCPKRDNYFVEEKNLAQALRAPLTLLTFRQGPNGAVPTRLPVTNPRMHDVHLVGNKSGFHYKHGGLIYDCPSLGGDCGGLLIAEDAKLSSGRIVGIHFGQTPVEGEGTRAIGTLVSRESISQFLGPDTEVDEQVGDAHQVGIPSELAEAYFEHAPNVRFHGFSRNSVFSPSKNLIIPSPISGGLGSPMSVVSRCTSDISGFKYGFSKMDRSNPYVSPDRIEHLIGHVSDRWPKPHIKEILSLEEAIEGKIGTYMRGIRQASGPGYNFKGKSGKFPFLSRTDPDKPRVASPELLARIKRKLEEMALGRSFHPYEEYQKSERLAPAKMIEGDPTMIVKYLRDGDFYRTANRLTNAQQLDTQIIKRALIAPWYDMDSRRCPIGPSMIGFNPHSLHWHAMDSVDLKYLLLALDARAFDISINKGITSYSLREKLRWLWMHLKDCLNWLRHEVLLRTRGFHFHVVKGFVFGRFGGASGDQGTTSENDGDSEAITLYLCAEILIESGFSREDVLRIIADPEMIKMFFVGDDSRVYIHPDISDYINNVTFARAGKRLLGMDFTSSSKEAEITPEAVRDSALFLSRHQVLLDGFKFGAFPIDACVEIARWITDVGDRLEMARDNCEASLRELFFHGKEVFDHYKDLYAELLAKAGSQHTIRIDFGLVYDSVFDHDPLEGPLTQGLESIHPVYDGQEPELSQPVTPCSRNEEEEDTTSVLERGVRLLQNKGFPVDMQRMLAQLSETRTCNRELRQVLEVQPIHIRPYPMASVMPNDEPGSVVEQSSDLREPQLLPVTERTETQTLQDETKDIQSSEPVPAPMSLYDAANQLPDHGLHQVLSRPYEVFNGQWQSTDAAGTRLVLLNFPGNLFAVPQIQEKLQWFSYFRCKGIKLAIRLNLTAFHFGCLCLSHVEGQNNWGYWPHDGLFRQCLNNDPTYLSAMGSPVTELEFAWTLPWQWMPIVLNGSGSLGTYNVNALYGVIQRVQLHVVQALSALGDSVTPGSVSIFANFVDPEVQGPTLAVNPFPTVEEQSGEGISKAVRNVVDTFEEVLRSAVSLVSVGTSTASFLGSLDKPTLGNKDMPVVYETNLTMTHVDGGDNESKNSLFHTASLSDTEVYSGGNMSHLQLCQRPAALDYFAVPGATYDAGDLVKSWVVHPCFNTYTTNPTTYNMVPTYLQHASAPFKFWRGSLKYQLRFFGPRFTTSRFRLVWIPSDKGLASVPPATLAGSEVGDLYSKVFDVTGDTIEEVSIPWLSPVTYRHVFPKHTMGEAAADLNFMYYGSTKTQLSLGTSNGTLALYLVNDLTSPATTVPVNLTVVVYVSAGDDYQVMYYGGTEWAPSFGCLAVTPALVDEQSGNLFDSFKAPFDPITPSGSFAEHGFVSPEKIGNIVELLKRYVNTSTYAMSEVFNPIGFLVANTGVSHIPYWMSTFVWARGGVRMKAFDDQSSVRYENYSGMYDAQSSPSSGEVSRWSVGFTMATSVTYPYAPMPYWPTGVDLLGPRSNDGYYPFTSGSITGDARTIGAKGLWGTTTEGDFAQSIAVSDDFALYGLYSPLEWFKSIPPLTLDSIEDSPELAASMPPSSRKWFSRA